MLGSQDRHQPGFWDNWISQRLLPEDHLLMRIDRAVDFSFVEKETKDLYSPDQAKPSYPPEQLFRFLFLAFLYNLSDVRFAEELCYNLM